MAMDNVRKAASWFGQSVQYGWAKTVDVLGFKMRVQNGSNTLSYQQMDTYGMPRYMQNNRAQIQQYYRERRRQSGRDIPSNGRHGQGGHPGGMSNLHQKAHAHVHFENEVVQKANSSTNPLHFTDERENIFCDARNPSGRCFEDPRPTHFQVDDVQEAVAGPSQENDEVGSFDTATIDILSPPKIPLTKSTSQEELNDWIIDHTTEESYSSGVENAVDLSAAQAPDTPGVDITTELQKASDEVANTVDDILGQSMQQVNVFDEEKPATGEVTTNSVDPNGDADADRSPNPNN